MAKLKRSSKFYSPSIASVYDIVIVLLLTLNVDLNFGLRRAQTVASIAAILARILHLRLVNHQRTVVVQVHFGRRLLGADRLVVQRPLDAWLRVACI